MNPNRLMIGHDSWQVKFVRIKFFKGLSQALVA